MSEARAPDLTTRQVLGLDLGRQADPSALARLEWTVPVLRPGAPAIRLPRPAYRVPTLKRWQLGTPYTTIVSGLVAYLEKPPLAAARPAVVIDATGVGAAVCDAVKQEIRKAKLDVVLVAVTITAGSAVTDAGGGWWRVAKKQLASVLQVVLGSRRLLVAPGLREAPELVHELETFSVKITDAGNESYESWREGDKDDLVLAVALAAWWAERVSGGWAGSGRPRVVEARGLPWERVGPVLPPW
jgi:hypothetical protein